MAGTAARPGAAPRSTPGKPRRSPPAPTDATTADYTPRMQQTKDRFALERRVVEIKEEMARGQAREHEQEARIGKLLEQLEDDKKKHEMAIAKQQEEIRAQQKEEMGALEARAAASEERAVKAESRVEAMAAELRDLSGMIVREVSGRNLNMVTLERDGERRPRADLETRLAPMEALLREAMAQVAQVEARTVPMEIAAQVEEEAQVRGAQAETAMAEAEAAAEVAARAKVREVEAKLAQAEAAVAEAQANAKAVADAKLEAAAKAEAEVEVAVAKAEAAAAEAQANAKAMAEANLEAAAKAEAEVEAAVAKTEAAARATVAMAVERATRAEARATQAEAAAAQSAVAAANAEAKVQAVADYAQREQTMRAANELLQLETRAVEEKAQAERDALHNKRAELVQQLRAEQKRAKHLEQRLRAEQQRADRAEVSFARDELLIATIENTVNRTRPRSRKKKST